MLFIVNIPDDFRRKLIRGLRPQILIEADASDSLSAPNALAAAVPQLTTTVFNTLFKGPLENLHASTLPIDLVLHQKYNPENITQYNTYVRGLLGVVLTMTIVLIINLAITREGERGTLESLLATPVRPLEVMVGKITPYIIVGYTFKSLLFY